MVKELIVRIETNYGQERIYPVNEQASLFTMLTGKKTLSRQDLKIINSLGYLVSQRAAVL